MKRIITTPAGRKRYLEILFQYLLKYREQFDRWDLWVNTENKEDIKYLESLKENNEFINLKYLKVPYRGCNSICSFFKDYCDEDEIYLRLDDDIVYIHKNAINKMFEEREKDKSSFLIYGNIVNNAIITHLHQRKGVLNLLNGISHYDCMNPNGWNNPLFAENVHRQFLEYLKNKKEEDFFIQDWILYYFERVSINAISWRGDEFIKFSGKVGEDEELWLSVDKPKLINKKNKIIGDALFSHYAFHTQRAHLDKTNILSLYKSELPTC